MKKLSVAAFVVLIALVANAQSDPFADFVHQVEVELTTAPNQYQMPSFTVEMTTSQEVNAFADTTNGHKIWINRALVQAFYGSPGELAFVIAHEAGHLQDKDCKWRVAKMPPAAGQRFCEANADWLGVQYLMAAGFNPWAAGGAMGRLMMAAPQGNSITALIIGRFKSDHPISIDRINQLGADANRVCVERAEICRAGMWAEHN